MGKKFPVSRAKRALSQPAGNPMLRVVLLVMALTAGGVAAWLALSFVGGEAPATTVHAPAPLAPTQEVLVAAGDLARGDKLEASSVRWQAWPQDAINPDYILRSARPDAIETLSGIFVRNRFISSEPILEAKLADAEASFLSAILPSGKRAVALRVSAENTAGGFILPNDRVDVLHTVSKGQDDSTGGAVTRTLLHNVRVLAIDQTGQGSDQKAEEKTSDYVIGKTATLELDPEQTEMIATAQADGMLSLSLRSVADRGEVQALLETSRVVRIVRAGRNEFSRTQ